MLPEKLKQFLWKDVHYKVYGHEPLNARDPIDEWINDKILNSEIDNDILDQ